MIDFLVNMALNLRSKTHQKWCQEAFKILKNAIKNLMQVGIAFGTLLERILVDFVAKLGGKLEPSCTKIGEKLYQKTMSKKSTQKDQKRRRNTKRLAAGAAPLK